jgi:HPt (histidine-containing phosphotransfer) domain-containing protein
MFIENGFDGFISKPIDIRQLNDSLNKLIRDRYPPEVVSAAAALRQTAGDNAKPAEVQSSSDPKLSAMFVLDAEKSLAGLEIIFGNKFCGNEDLRQYVIDTHKMKSALANIGETELSAAAFKLEQAGREEDITVIAAETPAFLKALREAIYRHKPKEDDDAIAKEESEDPAYLSEKLLAIQTACENYDIAAVNETLAELGQNEWPRPVKKLLDAISGYLLNSDFEEAAKLAKDYNEAQ